jgi:hypothetical protein
VGKIHNEELNDLYPLSSIMWVIKARRMRLAWHGGEERGIQGFGAET